MVMCNKHIANEKSSAMIFFIIPLISKYVNFKVAITDTYLRIPCFNRS